MFHAVQYRLLNIQFLKKQGQKHLYENRKPFFQQKRQCYIRTDRLYLKTLQSITTPHLSPPKKINAFISNEA